MRVLITGGAGYIGRHTARLLRRSGIHVVVLDNFSSGANCADTLHVCVVGDIRDGRLLGNVLREHRITVVLHLAAHAHAAESVRKPEMYFSNNVAGSMVLLEAMVAAGVPALVFASSCAVYGEAALAREGSEEHPMSPYGESKIQVERSLRWLTQAHGLRWLALRYFNVAGAAEGMGEDIATSARIIPRTVHAALCSSEPLPVYGGAYATPDGSAVRDFVHVADVAEANLTALRRVAEGPAAEAVNIGSGVGASVLEIIDTVRQQTGCALHYEIRESRSADPARVVADISRAHAVLGWRPRSSGLSEIVASVIAECGAPA